MNYPHYTNIIQICFLPDDELVMPREMFDSLNLNQGVINMTILLNESEWEKIMDCYISECRQNQQIPILHLDMHGYPDGFAKDSADFINWERLINKITELNQACNGQLFLSLNVCKGLEIYNHVVNGNNISLHTIGSKEDVNAGDGKRRFSKLYLEYFRGKDMNNAIKAFHEEPRLNPEHGIFELVN